MRNFRFLLCAAALVTPVATMAAALQESGPPSMENVPAAMRKRVNIRAVNSLIGGVLRSLSAQSGVEIKVDRDVPGELRVDVLAKGDSFWDTLSRLAFASHLKVEITGPRSVMVRPLADFWVWYRGRLVGHVREYHPLCRKCDYERKKEWRFCPMCGERLTNGP